jgi:two-component system sensor histidine kinase UhpB
VDDDGIAGRVAGAVNDLLGRIEREQRAAGASALAGQEGERARIAQELHDGVGQSLTAILLEAGRLAGSERVAPEDVGRIRDVARDSLDEVRRVARQLRPHVLEDLGLRSALSALTTDLFEHGGTHARRSISPALPDLDETVELVVFRVAQEALTNVARHADATSVELRLTPLGDDVVLVVADDGRGVPRGADGTGLRGMRERAGLVGGTVDVTRREGGGTVVTLVVPVVPR